MCPKKGAAAFKLLQPFIVTLLTRNKVSKVNRKIMHLEIGDI